MSASPLSSSRKAFCHAALALLAVDAALLLAHFLVYLLKSLGLVAAAPDLLHLETQWGLASLLMYGKWLAIICLLSLSWRQVREPLFLSLAIVFLFLLVDDSLGVHERIGAELTQELGLRAAWGLRGNDFGKLAFWAFAGAACFVVFILGYLRSSRQTQRLGHLFLAGIAGLVVVGIGIDLVSVLAKQLDAGLVGRAARFGLRMIEDGGEMILGSLLVTLAYAIFKDLTAAVAGTDWPRFFGTSRA